MASTSILFAWSICAVVLIAGSGVSADPAVSLVCPPVFMNGTDNAIRYEVDSAAIASAGCLAASNVVFRFVPKGQAITQLCSAPYPPTSCSDFTTSDNCGCEQQKGTTDIVYTYKYNFPVDDSHVGGRLVGELCVGATTPIEEFRSRSCDSVSFGGTFQEDCCSLVIVIVLLVLALFLFCALIVIAILHFIYGRFQRIWVIVVLVVLALAVVILHSYLLYCTCEDSGVSCTECVVVIVFVVIHVIVAIIVVVIINKTEVWILFNGCCCMCFMTLCCIFCKPKKRET